MGRTNIVLDEDLIEKALEITGSKSKREVVDIALKKLVSMATTYRQLRKMKGKFSWQGDISGWRKDRS
jgi:Arc/MetJ family transcription regulator